MKTSGAKTRSSGLTLIEVLVVIAVIAIFAAMLLPAKSGGGRAKIPLCMSHQKQIAIGLMMFHEANGGNYPWQIPMTNSGVLVSTDNNRVFPHFRVLSLYLGNAATPFVCPADQSRLVATNGAQVLDENISYFLNLDVTTNRSSILTGDRNLEANYRAVSSGTFIYSTNILMNWTPELHGNNQNLRRGVLSFADGHAQWVNQKGLNPIFQNLPARTSHLVIP